MMVYLVEHFYSIQGEGRYVGTPSLFFRFGGCNMRCEGFGCEETTPNGEKIVGCDTIYAVNREHFLQNWIPITSSSELLNILNFYDLPFAVDVVLTGGEPLIYANEPIFIEFLEKLDERGHKITFETNGTLSVDFEQHVVYKKCIFALSVKLSNSNETFAKRVKGEVISNIALNAKEAFFKFSIDADSINMALEDEILEITSYAQDCTVFCMPLGGTKEEVEANTEPLIEFCKAKGYNFSDRLHIRVWNQNRGV